MQDRSSDTRRKIVISLNIATFWFIFILAFGSVEASVICVHSADGKVVADPVAGGFFQIKMHTSHGPLTVDKHVLFTRQTYQSGKHASTVSIVMRAKTLEEAEAIFFSLQPPPKDHALSAEDFRFDPEIYEEADQVATKSGLFHRYVKHKPFDLEVVTKNHRYYRGYEDSYVEFEWLNPWIDEGNFYLVISGHHNGQQEAIDRLIQSIAEPSSIEQARAIHFDRVIPRITFSNNQNILEGWDGAGGPINLVGVSDAGKSRILNSYLEKWTKQNPRSTVWEINFRRDGLDPESLIYQLDRVASSLEQSFTPLEKATLRQNTDHLDMILEVYSQMLGRVPANSVLLVIQDADAGNPKMGPSLLTKLEKLPIPQIRLFTSDKAGFNQKFLPNIGGETIYIQPVSVAHLEASLRLSGVSIDSDAANRLIRETMVWQENSFGA